MSCNAAVSETERENTDIPRFLLDVAADSWDESFLAWARAFRAELQPDGLIEEALVEQLLMAAWRVRRSVLREIDDRPGDRFWSRDHAQAQRDWSRALADWNRQRRLPTRAGSRSQSRPEPAASSRPLPSIEPAPVATPSTTPENLPRRATTPPPVATTEPSRNPPARPTPTPSFVPDPPRELVTPDRSFLPPSPPPLYHGAVIGPERPGIPGFQVRPPEPSRSPG